MKEYKVTGMTCAACSARVESAVKKTQGVESCSVSLLTNSMTATGDYNEKELIANVKKAGYGVFPKGEQVKEEPKKENGLFSALITSAVLLLILMYFSMGHMLGLPAPSFLNPMASGLVQLILSSAILLIHRRFFISGIRSLFHLSPNMDTLVCLGSGASFGYSLVRLFQMTALSPKEAMAILHDLYFESAAMILVLITVGKLLEERSKGKTTSAIRALQKLSPDTATVMIQGVEREVALSEVKQGDTVLIRPGEHFPVDGTVMEGEGAADESALTGESVPVDKKEGDRVYTGTVNLSGRILCHADQVGSDTALSRIIDRVTAASASKAPIARLADRVSGIFVPVVMSLALISFVIWLLLDAAFGVALSRGIAVLVVSCPCALGLATPVAIMVGNGVAARHGVLFKTAAALEEAGKVKTVILDKTGTVTTGKMKACEVLPYETEENELISVALSLESGSVHPIALAVMEYGKEKGVSVSPVEEFQNHTGFGVSGKVAGKSYRGGKKELLDDFGVIPETALKEAERLAGEGKTVLFFGGEDRFLGLIALSDTVKEDSAEAIEEMKKMGLNVVLLTGDRKEAAETIGEEVGIEKVIAGVLPEEKEAVVASLQKDGKVCMVGDGINDAPALTRADIGIAIGAGVDIAMDAAEIVLMKSSLADVPKLIHLSRKTLKNIKENLFWAFCYNIIGIPLAAGAFIPAFGWSLTPMFGAAAMSFSSFFVVSNALRLNLFSWSDERIQEKEQKEKKKMEKVLKIEGMMCPHCEAHVKSALEALDGVKEARPSHQKKEAVIVLEKDVSDEILRSTVEKAGYQVL